MKLSREEVLHIARLARLGLTEEDVDKFREQLSNILQNFEILRQVDTEGVPPTAQSIVLQNIMRDDGAGERSHRRRENRLKLALQFDFWKGSSLRLVTGWELDKQDFGRAAYFDGGTIQLQATF